MLVAILVLSSLVMLKSAYGQPIPKPSVPEFALEFIKASYTVIDPYTGESQQVDNSYIEVTIKNQPFNYSLNGTTYNLYYNVQTKPHFGESWIARFPVIDRANSPYNADNKSWSISKYLTDEFHSPLPSELNSDYTVVSYFLNGGNAYSQFRGLPSNAQIDFQVEAIVGYDSQAWYVQHPTYPEIGGFYEPAIAYYADSGWSTTQTISISDDSVSTSTPNPSSNPTATPTDTISTENNITSLLTSLALAATAILVVVVISLLLYVRHLKRNTANPDNPTP